MPLLYDAQVQLALAIMLPLLILILGTSFLCHAANTLDAVQRGFRIEQLTRSVLRVQLAFLAFTWSRVFRVHVNSVCSVNLQVAY